MFTFPYKNGVSDAELIFKYADYYYRTNRYNFSYATTVDEALRMGGESLPECDLDKLLQSFPIGWRSRHLFYS